MGSYLVDTDPQARARRMHSMCLSRLDGRQSAIATTLGVSEASISRLKNDHLEMVLRVLSLSGLKVVDEDKVCVRRDEFLNMSRIVSRALANEQMASQLLFEDAE